MLVIWENICAWFLQYVADPIMHIDWRDVIDILVLTVILYQVYRFVRNRRAGRVLVGLVFVVLLSIALRFLRLEAFDYISSLIASAAFFCVIVIFQPEIRDALENIGNLTILKPGSNTLPKKKYWLAKSVADEVVDATFKMAESKTGALIIFEGITKLGDYMHSGKLVDARVTSHLLQNIFYDTAPLHDGAVIIRNLRIYAASCVLPSTTGKLDFGSMGTRHRAAVGVTEVSDSLALIVSEETGFVSVAQDGRLLRAVDRETLRDILMTYLIGSAYLRVKRGVHIDPFDGVPKLKRYDDETDYSSLDGDGAEPPKKNTPEEELPSQMNIFDSELQFGTEKTSETDGD